jgi:tetratricopeptide (TPR) repeat protein
VPNRRRQAKQPPASGLWGIRLAARLALALVSGAWAVGSDRLVNDNDPRTALRGEVEAPAPQPQQEANALKAEAMEVATRLAEAYPDDALTHALLGSACFNTGQSAAAVRHLSRCLELEPAQTDALEVLARLAYEKGEPEEAVRRCREALKHGGANPDLLNRLGQALLDLGQTDEAIAALRQAVGLPQPAGESYYLLGQAQLQAGAAAEAKASLRRATELRPDHTQAWFGLFTACQRLGQSEEATRYREQFQKLESTDRRALTDRNARDDTRSGLPLVRQTVARTVFGAAQIQRSHGQSGPATALYLRAAQLDGGNPVYRAALEAQFVQTKALKEGLAAFQQLAKEHPEDSLNYYYLARFHGRLQDYASAESAYRKAQELAPDWPQGYRGLAEMFVRADRQPAEARALARKAVELEPSPANYQLLAVTCVKNNDRAGAVDAMRRAVALVPNDARYREFLRQLESPPP